MITRKGSGTTWEADVGYSRAVRYNNVIEVSGTTASDGKKVFHIGDAYGQTKHILEKIEDVLTDMGSDIRHTIRTRMYVKNIEDFEGVGKAHGEVFGDIRPASTLVEVSNFVHPDILVEIELTAVVV